MKNQEIGVLFADYMDYSVEKSGRNISSPFEQLLFDLLCFYPSSIVLTLTSTLIGMSSVRLIEFYDFWKSGTLKIQFSEGDTADKYLRRKLKSAGKITEDNYELNLYITEEADIFVNDFLKKELLNKNIDYVFPRFSNADKNNRDTFLYNLAKYERKIIEDQYYPMHIKDFDKLALLLEYLADNSSFTFQRSHIINELVSHKIFPSARDISPHILSMFDLSYNEAMAKSVNGIMLSTMDLQLNGVGLRNFIKGYSPELYNLIISMSPAQCFLLVQDKNWIIYRELISNLYTSLLKKISLGQQSDFYKKTVLYEAKNSIIEACLDKMSDIVFDTIKYINPSFYYDIQNAKKNIVNIAKRYMISKNLEGEYYSEEIIKRTNFIKQICEDILCGLYI